MRHGILARGLQTLSVGGVAGEETVSEGRDVAAHTLVEGVLEDEVRKEVGLEEEREEQDNSKGVSFA